MCGIQLAMLTQEQGAKIPARYRVVSVLFGVGKITLEADGTKGPI